jgi:hypothetical protein
MFRFFVDDSGKEPHDSPAYILAGWMSRVDTWDIFSDAWDRWLVDDNPKPLEYHKGHRYFSNREAMSQTGCFAGFTVQEAAEKTANLAWLIVTVSPGIAGFTVTVPHDEYATFVKQQAVIRRGKLRLEQKLPFYIAFVHMLSSIHSMHYHGGSKDKVDFIFDGDKTDTALRECIGIYYDIKENSKHEPWYPIMGEMMHGDDKDLPPLQAADLFAGQLRQSIMLADTVGAIKLWEQNNVKILGQYIGKDKLEQW